MRNVGVHSLRGSSGISITHLSATSTSHHIVCVRIVLEHSLRPSPVAPSRPSIPACPCCNSGSLCQPRAPSIVCTSTVLCTAPEPPCRISALTNCCAVSRPRTVLICVPGSFSTVPADRQSISIPAAQVAVNSPLTHRTAASFLSHGTEEVVKGLFVQCTTECWICSIVVDAQYWAPWTSLCPTAVDPLGCCMQASSHEHTKIEEHTHTGVHALYCAVHVCQYNTVPYQALLQTHMTQLRCAPRFEPARKSTVPRRDQLATGTRVEDLQHAVHSALWLSLAGLGACSGPVIQDRLAFPARFHTPPRWNPVPFLKK